MKTQEQKLQHVMEAAGECWHEWEWIPGGGKNCKNCDIDLYYKDSVTYNQRIATPVNPSPDDLNELFRLAEKLGFNHSIVSNLKRKDSKKYLVGVWNVERSYSHASNPAAALLNSLFIATGGE